jgi:hypothetical protein
MATSMNDILNEPAEPKEPVVVDEAPDKEQKDKEALADTPSSSRRREHQEKEWAAQGRDPKTGQFVSKDKPDEKPAEVKADAAVKPEVKADPAKPAAPAPQEFTEKEKAFLRAAHEERTKRQELERRLAEIERSRQQPPATPAEQPKGFWEDPEGHFKSFEQRIADQAMQTRLSTAEMIARSRYQDFDQKIGVFQQVLQSTPGLLQQWQAAPDPAEFAYRVGKTRLELHEAGGMEGWKAKTEKELRLKIEAEAKEKADKDAAERAKLPQSLSEVKGAASQQRAEFKGPTPMKDILGNRG